MVLAKEDLGLSLSLSSSTNPTAIITTNDNNVIVSSNNSRGLMMNNMDMGHIIHHQTIPFTRPQLNLKMAPSFDFPTCTPPLARNLLHKLPWKRNAETFPPSDQNMDTCRSFLMGIDVNIPARDSTSGEDDDAGVSSPNSTVSTVSGKRSSGERDFAGAGDDADADRASSRGLSDEEDGGENSRKKLRLSKDQAAVLEESFKEHSTLNPKQKQGLAKRLGLRPRQVEVWFQNRRARTKLKQTEVDCEFLKGCAEKLTEENRRLQKEVQELRALKLSPQFYMHMTPPTTLTMCPSCERVATPSVSATASSMPNHRPMPINMWAGTPVRPFEVLQPRS